MLPVATGPIKRIRFRNGRLIVGFSRLWMPPTKGRAQNRKPSLPSSSKRERFLDADQKVAALNKLAQPCEPDSLPRSKEATRWIRDDG